jgi:hypothetical protein
MSLFGHNNTSSINLDYKKIGEEFCRQYYSVLHEKGFNSLLKYFNQNARCTFSGIEYDNPYDILLKLTEESIYKFNINKVSCTCQALNNTIIITSMGTSNPVNFQKQVGKLINFTETFTLSRSIKNGNYHIDTYLFMYN